MTFTNEQLTKAKAAKSVEELLALAKENGTELTEDEAKKYFADLHKEGEIADEELDNVSGGCGDPDPMFSVNQTVYIGIEACMVVGISEYSDSYRYLYKCRVLEGPARDTIIEVKEGQLSSSK